MDARTCKLIVIDKTINSMTTFKQIIGRGTRILEEYNKFFFTIMDFKRATISFFSDHDFDGEPVVIYMDPTTMMIQYRLTRPMETAIPMTTRRTEAAASRRSS